MNMNTEQNCGGANVTSPKCAQNKHKCRTHNFQYQRHSHVRMQFFWNGSIGDFLFFIIFFYFPSFLRCKCKYNILFEFCSIITFDVWHQCKNRTETNFAINSVVGSWDTFTIIVVNSFSFSLFYWFIHCLTIFFQRIYFIFSFIDSLWILSCTLSVLLRSSKIRGKAKKTILRLDL